MIPRSFDYASPRTLDDAIDHLAEVPGARVLAGGMSLIPMMKLRVLSPSCVIDIARIEDLRQIEVGDGFVRIGANVRQVEVAGDVELARRATALAEAASWTGDPQVRNRGTLCGSIAHADPSADQPAAALALGATMHLESRRGRREVSAGEFFMDAFETAMDTDEILTSVTVPLTAAGEGSAYQKLGRRGGRAGFPIVASAAWVQVRDRLITDARVALTSVATRPVVAHDVTEALIGTDGSAGAISSAVAGITDGVKVIPDLHGSTEFKSHLARVLTERSLATAIARATESKPR